MSAKIIPFPTPAKVDKWQTRIERFTEILGDRAMAYDLLIRLVESLPPESRKEFLSAHRVAPKEKRR